MRKIKLAALIVVLALTFLSLCSCNLKLITNNDFFTRIKQLRCEHEWASGKCTLCDLRCWHDYDDTTGKCNVCGTERVVPTPVVKCDHEWDQGICTLCHVECPHYRYVDYVCTKCGDPCQHKRWWGGRCSSCNYLCPHSEWIDFPLDRECALCHYCCMHHNQFVDGICEYCGYVCNHENAWNHNTDECKRCGVTCEHTFEGTTCTKCNYYSVGYDNPITVTFNDKNYNVPYSANLKTLMSYMNLSYSYYDNLGCWVVLTDDGEVELAGEDELSAYGRNVTVDFRSYSGECYFHFWADGVCKKCEFQCKHSKWVEGICKVCSYSCPHDEYTDSICNVCKEACLHRFKDGYCTYCEIDIDDVPGEIIVNFAGIEYLLPMNVTLGDFITNYLHLNAEVTVSQGYWSIQTKDTHIPLPYLDTYLAHYNDGIIYISYYLNIGDTTIKSS